MKPPKSYHVWLLDDNGRIVEYLGLYNDLAQGAHLVIQVDGYFKATCESKYVLIKRYGDLMPHSTCKVDVVWKPRYFSKPFAHLSFSRMPYVVPQAFNYKVSLAHALADLLNVSASKANQLAQLLKRFGLHFRAARWLKAETY